MCACTGRPELQTPVSRCVVEIRVVALSHLYLQTRRRSVPAVEVSVTIMASPVGVRTRLIGGSLGFDGAQQIRYENCCQAALRICSWRLAAARILFSGVSDGYAGTSCMGARSRGGGGGRAELFSTRVLEPLLGGRLTSLGDAPSTLACYIAHAVQVGVRTRRADRC